MFDDRRIDAVVRDGKSVGAFCRSVADRRPYVLQSYTGDARSVLVLAHEHVRFRDEAVAEQWPGRYDEDAELDAALEAVVAAKAKGVQSCNSGESVYRNEMSKKAAARKR